MKIEQLYRNQGLQDWKAEHQAVTWFIKKWADSAEILHCGSLQTLYRFDSNLLRSAQLFIYRKRQPVQKPTPYC